MKMISKVSINIKIHVKLTNTKCNKKERLNKLNQSFFNPETRPPKSEIMKELVGFYSEK